MTAQEKIYAYKKVGCWYALRRQVIKDKEKRMFILRINDNNYTAKNVLLSSFIFCSSEKGDDYWRAICVLLSTI